MAWHSFGCWKNPLFGEHRIYGPDGVRFCTRGKAVTGCWPEHQEQSNASFAFPSN